ncbi:helix-turn-helix transcriptional regulator [Roseovarius sp. D0-M9]|uniref:helix-turn-helix transcriptional regulator n=1 Tax=Roseovarius sp. D0-M9 TaxID=3127117 RepID=UPI0030102B55
MTSCADLTLANACASADAIALLFGPRVEVVVHDLTDERILHIANPLSHRTPGDPSNMHEIDLGDEQPVIGPYEKVNWDGSILRSISILQRRADGTPAYVICVNHDQADLHALQRAVETFCPAKVEEKRPSALFRNDWHDRLNSYASDWCRARGVRVGSLSRSDRRALICDLEASGALAERHAAAYVARMVGVSRATIYNDLKARAEGEK